MKHYEVTTGVLSIPGRDAALQGTVVTDEDLAHCGKGRCEALVKSGALREIDARQARVLQAAQEVADAPGEIPGAIDDQTHLQTLADEIERPERERLAREANEAEAAPGPVSPRISHPVDGGKGGRR